MQHINFFFSVSVAEDASLFPFENWILKIEAAGLSWSKGRGLQCPQAAPFNLKTINFSVKFPWSKRSITHIFYKKRSDKEWQGALVPSHKIEYKEATTCLSSFSKQRKKLKKEKDAEAEIITMRLTKLNALFIFLQTPSSAFRVQWEKLESSISLLISTRPAVF